MTDSTTNTKPKKRLSAYHRKFLRNMNPKEVSKVFDVFEIPAPCTDPIKISKRSEETKKRDLKRLAENGKKYTELMRTWANITSRKRYIFDVEHKAAMEALRQILKTNFEKDFHKFKHFTIRQLMFLRYYSLMGHRNVAACMRAAGYMSARDGSLFEKARMILEKENARELLRLMDAENGIRNGIDISYVVDWFTSIAKAAMESGDYTNANRAMENLAKHLGMFVDKKEVTHRNVVSMEALDERIQELTNILREADLLGDSSSNADNK